MPPNNSVGFTITATDKASQTVEKVRLSVGDLAKGFTIGALATQALQKGFSFLTSQIGASVRAFTDAESAQTRMAHILKTATDATDGQIQALLNQAEAMEQVGVVQADLIVSAQGTLATFDLQAESIHNLIPAFMDMVVAERGVNATTQDMIGLANGLGKVLQGQVGALSKQGFVFSKTQEEMLKYGTEAQKVKALNEILGSTYQGLNEKMRSTTEGGIKGMQMSFGKLQEQAGKGMVKSMQNLIQSFGQATIGMGRNVDVGRKVFQTLGFIGEFSVATATGMTALATGVMVVVAGWYKMLNALGLAKDSHTEALTQMRNDLAETTRTQADMYYSLKEKNDQTIAEWDKASVTATHFGNAGVEAYTAIGGSAEEVAKKVKDANDAIADTQRKIIDLIDGHNKDLANTRKSYAQAIVDQEKLVKDLKKQLRQEDDEDEKEKIANELAVQQDALAKKKIFNQVFATEIAEEKRRNALTDFEREVEDIHRRSVEQYKEHNKKMELLKIELAENEKKRGALNVIETGITSDLNTQMTARTASVGLFANRQVTEANRVKSAWENAFRATSLVSSTGGSSRISTKKVNDAIITPNGQVIETHPKDYIIATKTPFSGGGQNISVTITGNTFMSDDATAEKIGNQIIKVLKREQRLSVV